MDFLKLRAVLGLDSSEYENGLNNAEKSASSFGSALKAGLGTVAVAGAAAVTVATGAAVAFGTEAVKVGAEFDSAMSQIAATLGLTMNDIENNVDGAGDTFDALREKAKEMGSATNFSASEAAEGLNILAMSGFSAEDSMSMLEDVLHLAAAGSMDMASAASYVAGAMKGFNDETKDSGYYADLMAKGATMANTSVSQLGEAMASGAAGAAAYSQDAESMTIALLRLAEQGEVGSAAGTSLAAAMKNLYTPTDQAKVALEQLGVAAYDETGAARDFNIVVNELDAALSNYSEEEKNAYKQTIFGIQGLNAYNKMTVTSVKKQEEWADALAVASAGAGEAAQQYNTMTDNLQGDIDIWNSALDGFKIAISDQLMPTVREFVQFGSDGVSKITAAFEEGGFGGAMEAFGQVLSDGLNLLIEMLPDMMDAGMKLLGALGQGILDNLPTLIDAGMEVVAELATGILDSLPEIITTAIEIIKTLATGLIQALPNLIPAVVDIVLDIVDILIDNIDLLVDGAIAIVVGLAEGIINALPRLLDRAPEIIEKLVQALIRNVPKLLEAAWQIIVKLVEGIVQNLPQITRAAADILKSLSNGLITGLSGLGKAVSQIVQVVKDAIGGLINSALSWGKDMLDNFIGGIKAKVSGVVDAVKGVGEKIKSFLGFSEPDEGPLSNFHTYAPDMMKLFTKGIADNEQMLYNQIEDTFDLSDAIKNATGTVDVRTTGGVLGRNNESTIIELLREIAAKEPVEISPNSDGIFNLVKRKNNEYYEKTGDYAFMGG